MVTDSFGMRKFMQRMGWLAMHPDGPSFFPFVGGVEGVFFSFVPNVFPTCSHQVLKFFPKAFPIAPQFNPIWFCLKFNFHVYKLKGRL